VFCTQEFNTEATQQDIRFQMYVLWQGMSIVGSGGQTKRVEMKGTVLPNAKTMQELQ
jgi:hypothetical protein